MERCFVIQPFDGGQEFDKRYEDVFEPAIKAAGLEPYRVDRDPAATILIEDIQNGIKSSAACLADITLDNPNVWFELGYAIAACPVLVLACASSRKAFPFDVQHRNIIRYSTESPRDFGMLKSTITERLKAQLATGVRLERLAQSSHIKPIEGLEQFAIAALVVVAELAPAPTNGATANAIVVEMERAGFTALAAALGIRGLLEKQFLEENEMEDGYNTWSEFKLADSGVRWLLANSSKLKLRARAESEDVAPFEDGEIPF